MPRALAEACSLGAYRPAHRLSDPQRHVRGRLVVRDAVVRTRTRHISLIRALLRQHGFRVPSGSAESFVHCVQGLPLPGRLRSVVALCHRLLRRSASESGRLRQGQGVVLTDAGQDLAPIVEEIESIWREVHGDRKDAASCGHLQVLRFSTGSNAEMHGLFSRHARRRSHDRLGAALPSPKAPVTRASQMMPPKRSVTSPPRSGQPA